MMLRTIIFLLIVTFLKLSSAQQVTATCTYSFTPPNNLYTCMLDNAHVTSPDQFLTIVGQHFPDQTDENVQKVLPGHNLTLEFFNGEILRKFVNLQLLELSSQLREFSKNSFDCCSQLQVLRIYFANITTFPHGLFTNCRNLRQFEVQHSAISSLPSDLFGMNENLETFFFTANQLTTLPRTLFKFSKNLKSVILSDNQITYLDPLLFANVRNLESINLSSNRITNQNLIINLLNNHSSLKSIILTHSGISRIDFNFFSQFLILDTLEIHTEQLLTNIAWTALPGLLTSLTIHNIGETIPENAFSNLQNLTSLSLHGNQIKYFHQNIFGNQKNLKILSLEGCGLTSIHPQLFNSLHSLHHLSLCDNDIEELPEGAFAYLTNLGVGSWEALFILNNKIKRLNANAFSVHPNLTRIFLSGNQICEIEAGFFAQSFPNLKLLSILGNECVDSLIMKDFDENPELQYCFANWLGVTTSTMTTTTDSSSKSMTINLTLILISIISKILIKT